MDNMQTLTDKQLKCTVWGEVVRNLIFLMLVLFVALPIVFVALYTLFGTKIYLNLRISAMIAHYWKYAAFMYPTIRFFAIVLLVLFATYLALSKISRDNSVKMVNSQNNVI